MDLPVDMIEAPSPNFDARTAPPDMIILHYTGMQTGEAALAQLRNPTPGSRVSAHYLVEEDGRIFRLVDEARRAWHAGVAQWAALALLAHATLQYHCALHRWHTTPAVEQVAAGSLAPHCPQVGRAARAAAAATRVAAVAAHHRPCAHTAAWRGAAAA